MARAQKSEPTPAVEPEETPIKKGHATPTRKEQEAARRRPLVPKDRRLAAQQNRAAQQSEREKARIGMAKGDERYLPIRDKGPQKRYVRDYVDARFSFGELLIPLMFLVIILTFFPQVEVQMIAIIALWAFFILAAADAIFVCVPTPLTADGKPDLPPIVIEDQGGGVAAQYDYRRGAVVLDRESVVAAVVATVPPRRASALRASLSTRAALLAYLESHPEAVGAVVKDHDVLIVHELTHAWQDRRDPIFREMARGNIPDVQPLEYEEEAYLTQNLYLRSKLANDPASVKMGRELDDYILLGHGLEAYRGSLASDLETASPARAHSLRSIHAIETERIQRTRNRPVQTAEEQQAKALDLAALSRGRRELAELERAHVRRMAALKAAVDKDKTDRYKLLGSYYLVQGRTAQRATDRSAWLDQAERYAKASGSAALIDEVRKAKEKKE